MRALIRVALATALAALLAAITAGCAGESARLSIGQDRETGEPVTVVATLPDTVADTPYSFGGWVMCLDRPGSVTVEKAELLGKQGDIVLQAFSTRPQSREHPMLGNAEAPLATLGFPASGPPVTSVCTKSGEDPEAGWPYTELGLQYAKTSRDTARAEGVRLTYASAGERRTVDFALVVELCAPDDRGTPGCRDMYAKLKAGG
jgi:hypothetical protein